MSTPQLIARKQPRRPDGCEGHLTRRQAAAVLGFASEFKIRQYERKGLLRSVRGPMRTAFYPRAEVLALKARLGERESPAGEECPWSDADLIALLERPGGAGPRTALDLVREARISIERAERVYGFWSQAAPAAPASDAPAVAVQAVATLEPALERRGHQRLTRDRLIQALRDPDPRVRQEAFEQLRPGRSPG